MLGFSSYIFEKGSAKLSKDSKNLYCVITDSNGGVVKSKLIKLNDGVANNVFNIDDSFTSGDYYFKSYTNWMLNFDGQEAHIQIFKVVDPKIEDYIVTDKLKNDLDIQLLPEGGHLIDEVYTNVGVIVKDVLGHGVSNLDGIVFNEKEEIVTTFKTNSNGITKFGVLPRLGSSYKVKVNYLNKDYYQAINSIEAKGISITTTNLREKGVYVKLSTNLITLNTIANKDYKLSIHNGKEIKTIDVNFELNELDVLVWLKQNELFNGVNIITLFDDSNQPILERLVFNYSSLDFAEVTTPKTRFVGDSVKVSLALNRNIKNKEDVKLSVAVLPLGTKSYNPHANIISQALLLPYINGHIEQSAYYFVDIDSKKVYDLDNLLLTQGWSSYDWNVAKAKSINKYAFEDGIVINVNTNNSKHTDFLIYPSESQEGLAVELKNNGKSFIKSGFFPMENDSLSISALDKKGRQVIPNLYLQYSPSKIPYFKNEHKIHPLKSDYIVDSSISNQFITLNVPATTTVLDEVTVKSETERKLKINKLVASAFYSVDVFNESSPYHYTSLANYINSKPSLSAVQQGGQLLIATNNGKSFLADNPAVILYLDDTRLQSTDIIANLDMSTVDYIAYNRFGFGNGLLDGISQIIKIYTKKGFTPKKSIKRHNNFSYPLTFSREKKFYTPKYAAYNDDFFKNYGVIDWIPNCNVNDDGTIDFKIQNLEQEVILNIEGVVDNKYLVSDKKIIDLAKNY